MKTEKNIISTSTFVQDFIESIELKQQLSKDIFFIDQIKKAAQLTSSCFLNKKKLLIAGNGGSAADAQHFSGEIVGRFKLERKGYPAIALTTDSSIITAWSNDYDFETIFSRQIEALGQKGDVFFGISTSGNSKNIISAVMKTKKIGIKSICLLGKDGGLLKNLSDLSIIIPSADTARIQEVHILIIHTICKEIEKKFR